MREEKGELLTFRYYFIATPFHLGANTSIIEEKKLMTYFLGKKLLRGKLKNLQKGAYGWNKGGSGLKDLTEKRCFME